jgi:hypothetical protein
VSVDQGHYLGSRGSSSRALCRARDYAEFGEPLSSRPGLHVGIILVA